MGVMACHSMKWGHPFRIGGNTLSERVPVADGRTKGNENVIKCKGT